MKSRFAKSVVGLTLVTVGVLGVAGTAQANTVPAHASRVGVSPASTQEAPPSCGAVQIKRSGKSVTFIAGSSVTKPYMGSHYGLVYAYDNYSNKYGSYNASGNGGFQFTITASKSTKQDFEVSVFDTSNAYEYCTGYYNG